MIDIITFIMLIALALYAIFAGADFGAGILEFTWPNEQKKSFSRLVGNVLGPVWEANHIWLILVIVIMFTAFPLAYSTISITFHIPIMLMLLGIVLRGCAFTFRHYDAVKDNTENIYSGIFAFSSLLTPIAQGLIAGGMITGNIPANSVSFQQAYILPWLNIFSISVSIFLCFLYMLTAAVFLYCEKDSQEFKQTLKKKVRIISILTLLSGLFVFIAAEISEKELADVFFANYFSLTSFFSALICIVSLNILISKNILINLMRVLVSATVVFVLSGWWYLQFPYLLGMPALSRHSLNIYEIAAPHAVLKQLLIALVCGVLLIFPALIYLLKTFKFDNREV